MCTSMEPRRQFSSPAEAIGTVQLLLERFLLFCAIWQGTGFM